MKIQINSHDPAHAVIKEFFYERECDETTKFLGPHLNFPPGRMNPKAKKNDWTMKKFVSFDRYWKWKYYFCLVHRDTFFEYC